ncbi:YgcG family protein [Dongia sp.]|uniref:TPM domain-containing protein n=1 Tax=Dongia sp. TaxID=1977262 RepID=UPI0035B291AB
MRYLLGLMLLVVMSPALAQEMTLPALSGRVVDRAEILSPQAEADITAKLDAHEKTTANQIVVVTLPDLMGRPIEDWGLMLGRGWEIGQAGKNNGIIFLIAPNERELRIEVGYGLEGDFPDATASRVIRNDIIPHFKAGEMEEGVEAGVDAILAVLDGSYLTVMKHVDGGTNWSTIADKVLPFFFPILFIGLFFVMRLRRRWDKKLNRYSWYLAQSSGGTGGGFSSGRSSGGFSGRGGSFGGGGASGRW